MSVTGDPFGVDGQVTIVTGGGTGIGAATARLLATYGATPVIGSRKMDHLQQVARDPFCFENGVVGLGDWFGAVGGGGGAQRFLEVRDDRWCRR